MGIRLEGKTVAQFLKEDIRARVVKLATIGITPTAIIFRVGEREDDISYERGILRTCELLGIKGIVKCLPVEVSQDQLICEIEKANNDKMIHGIMIFRPLPKQLDEEVIIRLISPQKDIDCMNPSNLEKIFEGNSQEFVPCTPKAVIELLKYYQIPLKGANVVVVGRSLVVGKPLSMLLLDENATVTICHSKTKDISAITKQADVVVAAIGKARLLNVEYFGPQSVVIDVGINDAGDGKICGDVDYDQVVDYVKAITPAVGGVGIITTTILLNHVVKACERGEHLCLKKAAMTSLKN